jgi:hypothetical protein
MEYHVAPRILLELSGYSSVFFGTLQLLLTAWILWMGAQQRQSSVVREASSSISSFQRLRGLPRATYDSLFVESAAGLNSKLQYQLMLMMVIFAAHICAYGTLYYVVLLIVRVGVLAIFAFTRDQEVNFKALRRDPNGAGFGLVRPRSALLTGRSQNECCAAFISTNLPVQLPFLPISAQLTLLWVVLQLVDACMLAEALRRHLSDKPPLQQIPTYKATVYRMEATMAGGCAWMWSCLIAFHP